MNGKSRFNVLGIDPGMTGAMALYNGYELLIWDMPVHKRNKTKRPDCHAISRIMAENHIDHAYIEQVNAFNMGATSAYNFGWACGVLEACLACHSVPFTYITPQNWKKFMDVPIEKDAARARASQLLPEHSHNWDLKKHDGRAEAAIITLYGLKYRQVQCNDA